MTGVNKQLALGLAIVGLLIGANADAMEVTYDFTAEITDSSGSSPFDEGDLVMGSVTYRTDLTADSTTPNIVTYGGGGTLSLVVGGLTPDGNLNQLRITNSTDDEFLIRSSSIFDSSELRLFDTTGTVFSNTDIPTALPLSAFSLATFEIDLPGFGSFSGEIVELMNPTPEPGTATLLGLGLAVMAGARRRS